VQAIPRQQSWPIRIAGTATPFSLRLRLHSKGAHTDIEALLILNRVAKLVASDEVRISAHGYDELAEDELSVRDILEGVRSAVLVEEYRDFPKGPSVLVLQTDSSGQPVHVVWGIPKGYETPAVLITAYRPSSTRWDATFLRRLK